MHCCYFLEACSFLTTDKREWIGLGGEGGKELGGVEGGEIVIRI